MLLWLVLSLTFFLIHIAPGEPARLFEDQRITEEHRQRLRHLWGLDQPLSHQYVRWLGAAAAGEWGASLSLGRPVTEVLLEKFPNTCLLVAAAMMVEYGLGMFLGVAAARYAGRSLDHLIRVVSLLLFSVPVFWLGLLAIEFLSVRWPVFPTNQMISDGARHLSGLGKGLDVLHHLALPALTLGLARCGAVTRFVRNGMLEVMRQDYIRTARAKGLHPARVLWVHALRNSLVPLLQRFGIALPLLLSGSVVIEVIFSWPGIGFSLYQAILQRDYPVILAGTAFAGALVVLGTLLTDIVHAWVDPRVRHE